jgi:hypothetical protein
MLVKLRDVILPHALLDAMTVARKDRESLRLHLEDMWDDPPYPYVRKRMKKLFSALAEGDKGGGEKLAKEIRAFGKKTSRPFSLDEVSFEAKIDLAGPSGGVKTTLSQLRKIVVPRRTILREWVDRTPLAHYDALLENFFPEIYHQE